ncbi:MAG: bifunctional diaminohydroxyphosphoribosylaminopyrimidine deaminase/5-amino-6-(5-phosphoribosylamino)uracil reductase RibD [Nevskiaceae bacterium]|nr:MAG: bifunctional diaminohydroxyphosphoribosylaminopyrimidine deaminase/5-amino-6-(5-phosphoribosylamino)uracil reductase RibD [Nevskiaceae bacterium]TBR74884.1 MAG: bifunctional diaminohydroxyphosphoribosylaminopyrimidine deaminase/5-amino-6-(5-phosphoribosylamino)uracil reductase RibD [Nevskiaceae bacterium]
MRRALELAARGIASTHPNPHVGCVLVQGGEVVGEGWHQRAGEAHAEVHALAAAGHAARGATAYVTLEPCSHFGRTPPCADALIAAGVIRVVAAMRDPNPQVAGHGLERLRAAGVIVETGVCEREARELNRGFVMRHVHGRPWVTLKLAASLDGRTALANGTSQWITGAEARADVHHLRAEAGAVLTSSATVLADDPRLTVRLPGVWRQPERIVLDRTGRVPDTAAVWAPGTRRIAVLGEGMALERGTALQAQGVEVLHAPLQADGLLALDDVLKLLAGVNINSAFVECGPRLAGAFIAAGRVDELLLYVAPRLLGADARALAVLPPLQALAASPGWRFHDVTRIGEDLRVVLRPAAIHD